MALSYYDARDPVPPDDEQLYSQCKLRKEEPMVAIREDDG